MTDDDRPLSDNQVDDVLKAALRELGTAPGATIHGDTALKTARAALAMLSISVIRIGVQDEQQQPPVP